MAYEAPAELGWFPRLLNFIACHLYSTPATLVLSPTNYPPSRNLCLSFWIILTPNSHMLHFFTLSEILYKHHFLRGPFLISTVANFSS